MGKSLQPLNAMAVRPPINTPAAAANTAAEPITAESLGWQLRAALPPLRLHSVSLYDEEANVLWLSEGALGPDEHNVVLEAMETLSSDKSLACHEYGLEDGRVGIFLPVRAPQGALVGVAMILADLKSVSDGVLEKIVSPQVRTIMQKIAVLLRASSARSSEAPAPIPVAVVPIVELAPGRAPERTPTPARAAAPAPQAAPTSSAQAAAAKAAAAAATKPAANARLNGSQGQRFAQCRDRGYDRRRVGSGSGRSCCYRTDGRSCRGPTVALAAGDRRHPRIRAVPRSGNA